MKREPPLKIGDVFQSQFEIRRLIGAGGYGFVYHAYNRMMKRDVALKLIETPTQDRERRACLEAQVTERVSHPNVIRGYGGGVWNDRWIFLELELLRGRSVAQALQEHKRISVLEAFAIGVQIADGVHAAHVQSIIHRDLKPDNVFLESGGVVRVIDFGVAKDSGPDAPSTERDLLHGTGHYMPPEQLLTAVVTERSDLFSLGVILYEAIYGRCPALMGVETYNLKMIAENQIFVDPPALHELLDWVPPYAGAVVQCLIAKNPNDRFESMAIAAEVLRTAIKNLRSEPDPRVSLLRDLSVAGQPSLWTPLVSSKPSTVAELRTLGSQAPTKPVVLGNPEPAHTESSPAPATHTSSVHVALTVPVRAPRPEPPSPMPQENAAGDDGDGTARDRNDTAPLGSAFFQVVAPVRLLRANSAPMPPSAPAPRDDALAVAPPEAALDSAEEGLELTDARPLLREDELEPGARLSTIVREEPISRTPSSSEWVYIGVATHRQAARTGAMWGSILGTAIGVGFLVLNPAATTQGSRSTQSAPPAAHTSVSAASPAQIPTAAPSETAAEAPSVRAEPPALSSTAPIASSAPIPRSPPQAGGARPAATAQRTKATVRPRTQPASAKPAQVAKAPARATAAPSPSAPSATGSQKPASKSWIVVRGDDDVSWLPSSGLGKSPPADPSRIFDKPLVPPK